MQFPYPIMLDSTIKELSVGEVWVIEETGRVPDSSVKIKDAFA